MAIRQPDWTMLRLWGSALLPAQCALCAAACRQALCDDCHAQYLLQPARLRCHQCANPLASMHETALLCGRCQRHRPVFDATLAASDYAPPVDQLLLQLKFAARLQLAPLFAQLLAQAADRQPDWQTPQLLCPVPLGRARLVERGYNQALEIARPLARLLGLPLLPKLAVRVRETPAQSGVAPRERRANLARAFDVAPAYAWQLGGCHVGVVDDVMSSGHTVNALAAALKRHGAARVSILVAARTPPH
ncbi:ComF family protein [Janthinobacterium aquaticum]|uniref:ComF family protein n=1 Tax=Janthinobacterium sp. FT58W TaxID=2654254 RepID=UPI0012640F33|nr:ComF family protein [Janthinobacterium sp. FT58W]KAB8043004.1 ComF family protein [Janthinobacterium sp. FT58W]